MKKKQILVSVVAVAAVAILLSLPKVVIDNEGRNNNLDSRQDEAAIAESAAIENGASVAANENPHLAEISSEIRLRIDSLRERYRSSENSEKSAIFASSLMNAYESVGFFDSAAWYADKVAAHSAKLEDQKKAGNLYYEAYTHEEDVSSAQAMGEKAKTYYEKVLAANPKDLEAKAKLAMTYVSSSNPMQGISMLREVLEEDENNELAIFSLGVLSLQSGQHQKAAERFEKLVSLNPDHLQAHYWLGVSYFELGQKQKAKEQFEQVKQMDSDPAISASADNYLSRM